MGPMKALLTVAIVVVYMTGLPYIYAVSMPLVAGSASEWPLPSLPLLSISFVEGNPREMALSARRTVWNLPGG